MPLSLPLRVQGRDPDGTDWQEMTQSDDASFGGASFALKHPVEAGQALFLWLPLPKRFRRYHLTEPSYRVWAVVRDIKPGHPTLRIGAMFLGKNAPRGYADNPGARYLLSSDPTPARRERRQFQRIENIFLNLKLRRTNGDAPQEEQTVAENLGKGGARVMTTMSVAKGEILLVEELGGNFRTRAEICNVYIGTDKVPRLNLRFLDAEPPDRLIRAG